MRHAKPTVPKEPHPIDISFLERGYRILSFLVLGLVLMFVSFLYQKHFGRHAEQ